jgi:hypothetical protein
MTRRDDDDELEPEPEDDDEAADISEPWALDHPTDEPADDVEHTKHGDDG